MVSVRLSGLWPFMQAGKRLISMLAEDCRLPSTAYTIEVEVLPLRKVQVIEKIVEPAEPMNRPPRIKSL
ncbi:MAG: hypothetical protein ACKV2V_22785, partial [Blastocatellia bacterium]